MCTSALNCTAAFAFLFPGRGLQKHGRETQVSDTEQSLFEQFAELEATVRQLTVTALKLPPGAERRDSLLAIGTFRRRIAVIRDSELARVSTMQACKMSA